VKYPKLKKQDAMVFVTEWLVRDDISDQLVDGFLSSLEIEVGDLDLEHLASVGRGLHAAALEIGSTGPSLDQLEIDWSVRVFDAFERLPLEALGDKEFWSYCSVRYFWGFVSKRQWATVLKGRRALLDSLISGPTASDADGDGVSDDEKPIGLLRYVVGNDHYQIPLRLFLRGQAVRGDDAFLKDHPTDRPVDFWRSQILGVRTGAYPNWSRPMVAAQSDHGLPVTGTLRSAGRTVNRLRANVSPILHSEEEAQAIIQPIWAREAMRSSNGSSE